MPLSSAARTKSPAKNRTSARNAGYTGGHAAVRRQVVNTAGSANAWSCRMTPPRGSTRSSRCRDAGDAGRRGRTPPAGSPPPRPTRAAGRRRAHPVVPATAADHTVDAPDARADDYPPQATRVVLGNRIVLTLVAVVPFIVVIAIRAGHKYVPVGDFALDGLRVRDAWSRRSRSSAHTAASAGTIPGRPPSTCSRPSPGERGPAWGNVVANDSCKRGSSPASRTSCGSTAGSRASSPRSPSWASPTARWVPRWCSTWNPNVGFPMFPLFVLLAWVLATGKPRAVVFTITASILVQAHVGYLPLVVAAASVRSRSRSRSGPRVDQLEASGALGAARVRDHLDPAGATGVRARVQPATARRFAHELRRTDAGRP